MSEQAFKKHLPRKKLEKSKLKLSTYSGEKLEPKGECKVKVEYQGQERPCH